MNIAQDISDHIYQISGFTDNGMEISVPGSSAELANRAIDGVITLQQSFIISPTLLRVDWAARQISDLSLQSVTTPLFELDIEILLLGSGEKLIFPELALLAPFMGSGIGVEVMDSRAACRTYNLLSSEGRRVAAAIIL
jgi:uncharacterized protein